MASFVGPEAWAFVRRQFGLSVIKTAARMIFCTYIHTRDVSWENLHAAAMPKEMLTSTECTWNLGVILVLYKCNARSLSEGMKNSSRLFWTCRKVASVEAIQNAKIISQLILRFGGEEIGSLSHIHC